MRLISAMGTANILSAILWIYCSATVFVAGHSVLINSSLIPSNGAIDVTIPFDSATMTFTQPVAFISLSVNSYVNNILARKESFSLNDLTLSNSGRTIVFPVHSISTSASVSLSVAMRLESGNEWLVVEKENWSFNTGDDREVYRRLDGTDATTDQAATTEAAASTGADTTADGATTTDASTTTDGAATTNSDTTTDADTTTGAITTEEATTADATTTADAITTEEATTADATTTADAPITEEPVQADSVLLFAFDVGDIGGTVCSLGLNPSRRAPTSNVFVTYSITSQDDVIPQNVTVASGSMAPFIWSPANWTSSSTFFISSVYVDVTINATITSRDSMYNGVSAFAYLFFDDNVIVEIPTTSSLDAGIGAVTGKINGFFSKIGNDIVDLFKSALITSIVITVIISVYIVMLFFGKMRDNVDVKNAQQRRLDTYDRLVGGSNKKSAAVFGPCPNCQMSTNVEGETPTVMSKYPGFIPNNQDANTPTPEGVKMTLPEILEELQEFSLCNVCEGTGIENACRTCRSNGFLFSSTGSRIICVDCPAGSGKRFKSEFDAVKHKWWSSLQKTHPYLGIYFSPPDSGFSRPQRATALLTMMMSNALIVAGLLQPLAAAKREAYVSDIFNVAFGAAAYSIPVSLFIVWIFSFEADAKVSTEKTLVTMERDKAAYESVARELKLGPNTQHVFSKIKVSSLAIVDKRGHVKPSLVSATFSNAGVNPDWYSDQDPRQRNCLIRLPVIVDVKNLAVRIELWSQIKLRRVDLLIGIVEFNISMLIRNPGMSMNGWHQMLDENGAVAGAVFLQVWFQPDAEKAEEYVIGQRGGNLHINFVEGQGFNDQDLLRKEKMKGGLISMASQLNKEAQKAKKQENKKLEKLIERELENREIIGGFVAREIERLRIRFETWQTQNKKAQEILFMNLAPDQKVAALLKKFRAEQLENEVQKTAYQIQEVLFDPISGGSSGGGFSLPPVIVNFLATSVTLIAFAFVVYSMVTILSFAVKKGVPESIEMAWVLGVVISEMLSQLLVRPLVSFLESALVPLIFSLFIRLESKDVRDAVVATKSDGSIDVHAADLAKLVYLTSMEKFAARQGEDNKSGDEGDGDSSTTTTTKPAKINGVSLPPRLMQPLEGDDKDEAWGALTNRKHLAASSEHSGHFGLNSARSKLGQLMKSPLAAMTPRGSLRNLDVPGGFTREKPTNKKVLKPPVITKSATDEMGGNSSNVNGIHGGGNGNGNDHHKAGDENVNPINAKDAGAGSGGNGGGSVNTGDLVDARPIDVEKTLAEDEEESMEDYVKETEFMTYEFMLGDSMRQDYEEGGAANLTAEGVDELYQVMRYFKDVEKDKDSNDKELLVAREKAKMKMTRSAIGAKVAEIKKKEKTANKKKKFKNLK